MAGWFSKLWRPIDCGNTAFLLIVPK